MNLLRRYKISLRIWLLIAFSLIAIITITASSLAVSHQGLLDEKFAQTEQIVETTHSLIEHFYKKSSSGELSDTDARAAALSAVESIRYDDSNYLWINDLDNIMVMHPIKPDLNGKDLSQFKDVTGKLFFSELVETVKNHGEGHVVYHWPKPGHDEAVKKVSYVKGFKPWNWVIGTGIYIEDVEAVFWKNASIYSIIAIVSLTLLVLLTYLIISSITCPINDTSNALLEIAEGEGDLRQRLDSSGGDEISALSSAFNSFISKLENSMSRVAGMSHQLSEASTELTEVIVDGNGRQDKQYNEIHQVAAAVTEMSATVQEISNNAESAAESAAGANQEAKASMDIIQKTTDEIDVLMQQINQAGEVINHLEKESLGIGSVLDVIKSIAEQTNLLALNAAIEAARAGEQGRGFAVVADEVRTLSSRTQESTNEIQEMIERLQSGSRNAVEVINRGCHSAKSTVDTVKTAASSMTNIVREVENIAQLNTHIAGAVEEQTTVAREIDGSVNTISVLADQSNAGSERMVLATQNLNQLGDQLKELLNTFKLNISV